MKKSILLAGAALCAMTAMAEAVGDEIEFGPAITEVTAAPGETFEVPFNLTNTEKCTAFSWDIEKSDIFYVDYYIEDEGTEDETKVYNIEFEGKRFPSNYVSASEYNSENGNFRAIFYKASGTKLMPLGEGLFCTMTFVVNDDVAEGEYQMNICNIEFAWSGYDYVRPADSTVTIKVVATGLDTIEAAGDEASQPVFDLMGRPVDNPAPGLYIQGGRKVVVK